MGQLIAGPFCGQLLGDLGADVVKIEAPGQGDPMRQWGQPGYPLFWEVLARNKRTVSLDLRKPEGQDLARRLIARADILIENFRPGTLEGWNLSPARLHQDNPRPDRGARIGLWPDRPLCQARRIRRHRRGHGRLAPHRRRAGSAALAHGRLDRRQPGGDLWLRGRSGRAAPSRRRPARARWSTARSTKSVLHVMESLVPDYAVADYIRGRSGSILPGRRAVERLSLQATATI